MTKKIVGVFIALVLIAGGVLVVKEKKAALNSVPPPKERLLAVRTSVLEYGTFPELNRYLGTLRAKVSADIAPRISGHITEVKVREGDHVGKGAVLALLDDRQEKDRVAEIVARLNAARSALATQEGVFARDQKLFEAQALSQEALDLSRTARDAANAEVDALAAQLHSARTGLSYTRLTAPFDGVVTARQQDPGDLALPGKPVVSMEDSAQGYYLEIKVPEAQFPHLKKGARVWFSQGADAGSGSPEPALISRIHPAVLAGTLATVEADLTSRPFDLPTGATVQTAIETGAQRGFKVPLGALLENVDGAHVFLVDSKARLHAASVKILYQGPDFAVIDGDGLEAGLRVVSASESALLRLREGQEVMLGEEGHGQR